MAIYFFSAFSAGSAVKSLVHDAGVDGFLAEVLRNGDAVVTIADVVNGTYLHELHGGKGAAAQYGGEDAYPAAAAGLVEGIEAQVEVGAAAEGALDLADGDGDDVRGRSLRCHRLALELAQLIGALEQLANQLGPATVGVGSLEGSRDLDAHIAACHLELFDPCQAVSHVCVHFRLLSSLSYAHSLRERRFGGVLEEVSGWQGIVSVRVSVSAIYENP